MKKINYLAIAIFTVLLNACQLENNKAFKTKAITKAESINTMKTETWEFKPERDRYDKNSLLDLRYLNEKVAGETGFIHLSPDGKDFVKGNGQSIRFWAVNSYVWRKSYQELEDHARFLAKRGVNMVRWHGQIVGKNNNKTLKNIDKKAREQLWQYVATMKKEGIYLTLSPYYAHALKSQDNWQIPRDSKDFSGLLFFDTELQQAYKNWLKELLIPINPYTGISLKDEAAIAIIQLQNEDSLLFWTFKNLKGRDLELLSNKYRDWLIKKYGSLEQVVKIWKNVSIEGENVKEGKLKFYEIWHLTQPENPNSGKGKRLADQTQFLTETMYNFNQEIKQFLREEIGAKQLINAGNWKTADPLKLNDAERYSYTATEVIGVNRYYNGGIHKGEKSNWAIINGDKFTNRSVLFDPYSFPLNLKQVANHPIIIPESSWVPPLGYQSESPFLVSIFQSLTGIDGFYWFAMKEPQWRQPSSANGYLPSLGKWVINTPELLGNFPAAALMYRQGYIQQGETVVREHRKLTDLWNRQIPIISETKTFDPNRDQDTNNNNNQSRNKINPLAFLVGPVEVTYSNNNKENKIINLNSYINKKDKIIRSITEEITWDYGQGICLLNTAKAQGVTGFLKEVGEIKLNDLIIKSNNKYATIIVVSMDNKPIKRSEKLLVQLGTVARPTEWKQKEITWKDKQGNLQKGLEIINYGKAPWRIENNDIHLTINNPQLKKAMLLDSNGLAKQTMNLKSDSSQISLQLPTDVKYIILE
ncbi:hypothetical protein [Crocosphaera chwakensis]|uniref:Glycoside hydrolase family 42 N-terminal domain-containing protein n=1 Tax=Crocosphaera chwakensis CCY0110 TaxID=391612 RepID=A3ISF5_9CHRO|nr:hypothetical protein [Crocosphaera chwakensis]EAZ90525.1 hypothetical protein CY0110_20048 [Crocosphaera chwakensis CCY0110]